MPLGLTEFNPGLLFVRFGLGFRARLIAFAIPFFSVISILIPV